MSRFFFHVRKTSGNIVDFIGRELSDLSEARIVLASLASDVLSSQIADNDNPEFFLSVENEEGERLIGLRIFGELIAT